MKHVIIKRFKGITEITNIFERDKNHIRLKSLLRILSRYNPNKLFKYKIEQVNKTST